MSTGSSMFSTNSVQAFPSFKESYSKRIPNCQKCGQHGRKARLKGHKRVCPYKDCECAKCQVVSERQKLMANQIKMRRRQRKETILKAKSQSFESKETAFDGSANGPLAYSSNDLSLLYGILAQQPACNSVPSPIETSFPALSIAASLPSPLSSNSSMLPFVTPTSISMPASQTPLLSANTFGGVFGQCSMPVLNGMDPASLSEPSSPIRKSSFCSDFVPSPFVPPANEQLLALLTLLSQQQSVANSTALENLLGMAPAASVKQPEPLNCAAMAALFAKMCASQKMELGGESPPSSARTTSPNRTSFIDVCSI